MSIYADALLQVKRFTIQRLDGSSWVAATTYQPNQKYRFRALFSNSSPNTTPTLGPCFNTSGVHIVNVVVHYKLAFAIFANGGAAALIGGRQVDGHPDFNDSLPPASSRWFNFGQFTWIGPAASVSKHPVSFNSVHREIRYMQWPPVANLAPA